MNKNVFQCSNIILCTLTLEITIIVTKLEKSSKKIHLNKSQNVEEYMKLLKISVSINLSKFNKIFINII